MSVPRPATLHDVARRAGVGKTTASNALIGVGRLSSATRDAVRAAAAELGYVPNRAARHLRTGATGTIGVYIPETPTASDYYMRFVFGVLERAARQDVDVTVITSPSGSTRERLPLLDGLIICDPMDGDAFGARLRESGLPTVTCEDATSGPAADGVVWADHGSAIQALLDQMHGAGSDRPALIIPREDSDWSARLALGYRAWCSAHDRPERIGYIDWVPTTAHLVDAVARLDQVDPAMDGLICGPVDTAAMVLSSLRASGRRVGEDFLLACGTDSTALTLAQPPITAIDLVPRLAGETCAELLRRIMSGEAERGTRIELPIRLAVRASTRG